MDNMTAREISIHKSHLPGPPDIRILHANDVYHPAASEEEPVGGIARFQTLLNHYRYDDKFSGQPDALFLFSGDAFNPSRESSVTKGEHMARALNNIGIDAACCGNHEFDFGESMFRHLAKQCNFSWMCANIIDPNLGEGAPLGGCLKTKILTCSNGIKIGIIALVEQQWLEKINNSMPASIQWKSMVDTAKELAPKLREEGADIIIALTHARQPRDYAFAESIPPGMVDLILAGHDHVYEHKIFENGTVLLRSGTDFKNLSYVEVRRKHDQGWDFDIIRRDVVREIVEHPETAKLAADIVTSIHNKLDNRIGFSSVPLDARAATVSTQESNWGNFVADLMRVYSQSDASILTAFSIRADAIFPSGELLLKDIIDCFPFEDPIVVVKTTGQGLIDALENGVSEYPEISDRFPQVSNIRYTFDGTAKVGSRILKVEVNGSPIDTEKEYTIATRAMLASGKMDYETLRVEAEGGKAKEIVSEEEGILISTLLRQYFAKLLVVDAMKTLGEPTYSSQWDDISKEMEECHPTQEPSAEGNKYKNSRGSADDSDDDEDTKQQGRDREHNRKIMRKVIKRWRRVAGIQGRAELASEQEPGEFVVGWTRGIAPKMDGRIQIVNAQA